MAFLNKRARFTAVAAPQEAPIIYQFAADTLKRVDNRFYWTSADTRSILRVSNPIGKYQIAKGWWHEFYSRELISEYPTVADLPAFTNERDTLWGEATIPFWKWWGAWLY